MTENAAIETQEHVVTAFDYGKVHQAMRETLRKTAKEINNLHTASWENIRLIGEKLIDAKGRLQHGQFEDWVAGELPQIGKTTAHKFIHIATLKCSEYELFQLPQDSLAMVAAPAVPDGARHEIIDALRQGVLPKPNQIRELIDKHKGIAPVTKEQKQQRKEEARAALTEKQIQTEADRIIRQRQSAIDKENREVEKHAEARRRANESNDGAPDDVPIEAPSSTTPAGSMFRDRQPTVHIRDSASGFRSNQSSGDAVPESNEDTDRRDNILAACDGMEMVGFPGGALQELWQWAKDNGCPVAIAGRFKVV